MLIVKIVENGNKYMNQQETNFYKTIKTKLNIDIKARGLDGNCQPRKKHQWLLIPKEKGQKQYLQCLCCGEYSHT